MDEINCPHCTYVGFPNDFPDLYETEVYEGNNYNDQAVILDKMQRWGFNVVTCPTCGYVLLHETEVT